MTIIIGTRLPVKWIVFSALLVSVIAAVVIIYVFHPFSQAATTIDNSLPDVTEPLPPSKSPLGLYSNAAVVANAHPCADIGKDILKNNGKAVDALIATMLCDGVNMPQSMGVGGGFFMVFYDKKTRKSYGINARETAPMAATEDMFKDNPEKSIRGGLAVGVPGEIKGYRLAYEKFGGGISWAELFQPTIKLCQQGITIHENLERALIKKEKYIKENKYLSQLFVNPHTGKLLKAGDQYRNPQLAKTLQIISQEPDALYTGSLAESFVNDIKDNGGIITTTDLGNYKVRTNEEITMPILGNAMILHTIKPPSSGILFGYILKILEGLLPAANEILNIHRITEAFKFAYGMRSRLGDPYFVNITDELYQVTTEKEIARVRNSIDDYKTYNDASHYGGDYVKTDHGTAAASVIAPDGDAASSTSTINLLFGSLLISPSTGIILNNQMDDFSSFTSNSFGVKPSTANFIVPGKRPMSSMCPSIITDTNGDVRMTVGAAGGTLITTSVSLTTIRTLIFNHTVKEAIDAPMFHHQLIPMVWSYQYGTLKFIVQGMEHLGHVIQRTESVYACVNAINRKNGMLQANSDFRRLGSVAGF